MIYGINFGGPAIPDTPRTAFRKFKARIRVAPDCHCHARHPRVGLGLCRGRFPDDDRERKVSTFMLVGVGQSEAERDRMLLSGSNGSRRLHVVEVLTAGGYWFGIYAG